MKYSTLSILTLAMLLTFASCGEKKRKDIIVTKETTTKEPPEIQRMSDYSQSHDVKWIGSMYKVIVKRSPDTSLGVIPVDDNTKFYDNVINVRILRKDGSEFFNKTFSKSYFSKYISSDMEKHGALLGIVYVEAEGDNIKFAASVGSPDVTSDEYVPLDMKITRMGVVIIDGDSQMDTNGDTKSSNISDDDEDVE
nr:DUF4738 domain-containing protein [Prevotella sp.]